MRCHTPRTQCFVQALHPKGDIFPDLTLSVMVQSKKHNLSSSQQLLLSPQVQKKSKMCVFNPLLPLHLHY